MAFSVVVIFERRLREIVESQRRRQRGFAGMVEAALVAWLDLPYRATHLPVTMKELDF